uniref:Uncharacterized protein n=1 Tax=Aegilops tauschii subsp. strangulata TaxID=200361 RepID=A0A453KTJ4_AEGTS
MPLPRPHRQGWHTRGGRRQRSPSLPRQHLEFLHPLPRHALRPPRRRLTHRPLQPRRQANRVHFWACADDIHVARLCKMLSFSSPPFGSLEQNRNIGSRSVTSIPDSRGGS